MNRFRRSISKLFPNASVPLEGLNKFTSVSQTLLHRKRLIERCYPGSYTLNPYLLRSVKKLENLIDKHMEGIGAQRIVMPSLSPSHLWKETDRWDSMGKELLKVEDRHSNHLCLAPTHEETVCSMLANHNISYKSLPLLLYQITGKFRDEPHPKHGLLRSKEFLMKDLYSFDEDENTAKHTYNEVVQSYRRIFEELSLDTIQVNAHTGAMGGSMSHEFHLECKIGEDTLKVCDKCNHAINLELHADGISDQCPTKSCSGSFRTVKGIELAHSFLLGDRYSKPLDVTYKTKENKSQYAYMGCFGIGLTRLLAAAIEVLSTDNHMKMPRVISPYNLVIIPQKKGYKYEETLEIAENLYDDIDKESSLRGDVILDDRVNQSIGQRLRDTRLMGFPMALCVSKQALLGERDNQQVELIDLYEDKTIWIPLGDVTSTLLNKVGTSQ